MDYYDLERVKDKGFIETADGGHLIPDNDLNIGMNELYDCFCDSNGVDLKLISAEWFKNHLKWIVWKLDAYDRRLRFDQK